MANPNRYNWNAQDYAKNSANQFQWAKELIPKLKLNGNESLLDIGCGDGKITAELAKCLPHGRAVGIDSS
ncbi:methyltransferase, partial [Candidatus Bathyarchaeota archaeon]|nr:methyltransferase [Candidatus Bathyarchaeota archaeon]